MSKERSYTDRELLEQISEAGSRDAAIRYLYRSYFRVSENYVRMNTGSEQDAEDIFQDVVISFIELVKEQKFRGECSVSTFFYTLTRNCWLNEMKKRGRSKLREEKFEKQQDSVAMDIGGWIERYESKKQLLQLVGDLGEKCRKILIAFYYDNLSMREILQTLDYENEQVVRNKKYKCLKQLEQQVSKDAALINNLKSVNWYE
ncbi:MAG TPA: sigma-70 family RNA polymerase sigma factor [Flavitalea sp.]|nr:sigma-70 family RNA polymerase sigma factor [Flavitalea sp.]